MTTKQEIERTIKDTIDLLGEPTIQNDDLPVSLASGVLFIEDQHGQSILFFDHPHWKYYALAVVELLGREIDPVIQVELELSFASFLSPS